MKYSLHNFFDVLNILFIVSSSPHPLQRGNSLSTSGRIYSPFEGGKGDESILQRVSKFCLWQKFSKNQYFLLLPFLLLGNWNLSAQSELNRIEGQIEIREQSPIPSEQIVIKPLTKKMLVEAAVYETVTEKVLVKEASSEFVLSPAVYETAEESIKVQEETPIIRDIPAVYETMTERVMVAPESGEWVTTHYNNLTHICGYEYVPGKGYPIARWEKVPAQYKTITKKVLKSPTGVYETALPPVYETIEKQVLKTPETVEEVQIPAEYEVIERQSLVTPAYERMVFDFSVLSQTVIEDLGLAEPSTIITEIKPAIYKMVEEQILIVPESGKWVVKYCYDTNEKGEYYCTCCSSPNPKDCNIVVWERIPAQYETIHQLKLQSLAIIKVEKKTANQSASNQISFYEVTPAVYETIEEEVLVQPESGKWVTKYVYDIPNWNGCCLSTNPKDCNIVVWEKVPAVYETISKEVLVAPTVFKEVEIPFRTHKQN